MSVNNTEKKLGIFGGRNFNVFHAHAHAHSLHGPPKKRIQRVFHEHGHTKSDLNESIVNVDKTVVAQTSKNTAQSYSSSRKVRICSYSIGFVFLEYNNN